VNSSHTIQDIRAALDALETPSDAYCFQHGYPPKSIQDADEEKSVENLGLLNGTLIQKKI
jgi:hypothetical protein